MTASANNSVYAVLLHPPCFPFSSLRGLLPELSPEAGAQESSEKEKRGKKKKERRKEGKRFATIERISGKMKVFVLFFFSLFFS
jgi:hypothetical protein